MKKRLLVLSIDALFTSDLEYLKTLPALGRLISEGSVVRDMLSIYPSLTFPAHTSVTTGCYPKNHGVIHNGREIVGQKKFAWTWQADLIKRPTIFDIAKQKGYSTASVIWPVTGGANIDYLIPDIWPLDVEADPTDLFERSGSGPIMETVFKKNLDKWNWNFHPGYDRFGIACACDIVRNYRPDMLFIHLSPVDEARHRNGIHGPEVEAALRECDDEMSLLLEAFAETGPMDQLDFVLLGDHGQMNVERVFSPNYLLREAGLLQCNREGRATEWQAYVRSCDFSAQVFLADSADRPLRDRVFDLLNEWKSSGLYGIDRIMTREECLAEQHVDGGYSFVLESDGKTEFINLVTSRPVINLGEPDYTFARGTHGHMPHKGDMPPLVVNGPSFGQGVTIEGGRIIDIAPTLAQAYGLDMQSIDGKPITGLLK